MLTVMMSADVFFCLLKMAPRAVSRSSLLNHMAREHSFSIGLPDNIVYCSEFLDTLQDKLDRYANRCFLFTALSFVSRAFSFCSPRFSLQCLYCEKTFRDKTTLKEKSSPPHQRQKPRVRPLLRHQLPGKAQRHTRHTLPRQDKRSSSVEANARPECIVPILKRPSCPVRNWEKRGRSCKAKMTVSWRMMRMSKYPHVAL